MRRWSVGGIPNVSAPTVRLLELPQLQWTLLFLQAPDRNLFRACFTDYPAFVDGYTAWGREKWTAGASSALLSELRDSDIAVEEFPPVFAFRPLGDLRLANLGKRPLFRFNRYSVIPLVISTSRVDSVLSYFNLQLAELGQFAFFHNEVSRVSEPFQSPIISGKAEILESDELYEHLLAFGLPSHYMNHSRVIQAQKVLCQFLGDPEARTSDKLSKIYRPVPFFFRGDLRAGASLQSTHESEQEELCNALRAKWIRLLGWPEVFSSVWSFATLDAPRWLAAPTRGSTEEFLSEVDSFLLEMHGRYSFMARSPF